MIVIRNFNENFFEHELDESDENDNCLTTDYSDWTDKYNENENFFEHE